MSTTIEELNIELRDNADATVSSLERLRSTLNKLKSATKGGAGLTATVHQLESLRKAVASADVQNIGRLSDALERLSRVNRVNISKSTANQIREIGLASQTLNDVNFAGVRDLANALQPLSSFDSTGFSKAVRGLKDLPNAFAALDSFNPSDAQKIDSIVMTLSKLGSVGDPSNFVRSLNNLKKLPAITESLRNMDLTEFETQVARVAKAMRPLAEEMDKVAQGFSSFPTKLQKAFNSFKQQETQTKSLSSAYKSLAGSVSALGTTFTRLYYAGRRVLDVLLNLFEESSDYIETLNLFNVTMRDGAEAAREYAQEVNDALGIDVADWLEYQGKFQNMVTGYGVAEEQAAEMSKTLTQLSYDLSSVFNTDVETAFTKLESALSGQIKALKQWGVDVSVASLKQYMLNKGISASWNSLNTAQKAMLRYSYILEKTSVFQGDLARTLVTPANAMRILEAQITQFKRALGNLVSVLAVKVIPYVQAFLELITELIAGMAEKDGFEIPEIDYSALDTTAYTESMEETEEQVESLKRSLLGFDEINALNGDSGSNALGNGLADDLGLNVGSYDDFLQGAIEIPAAVRARVEDFFNWIKDAVVFIHDHIKAIGVTILAIAGINVLSKVGNVISALWGVGTAINASKAGVAFSNMMSGTFSAASLSGGLKNFKANASNALMGKGSLMTHLAGLGVGIAGLNITASGAEDLARALSSNTRDGLGKACMELVSGGAMSVVGGALVGGPVGAVIGGILALGVALQSAKAEEDALGRALVNTAAMNINGVKIKDLTETYLGAWNEMQKVVYSSTDLTAKTNANASAFKKAASEVDDYKKKLEGTGILTKDESETMSQAVKNMVDSISLQLTVRMDKVWEDYAILVSGASADVTQALNDASAAYVEALNLIDGELRTLEKETLSLVEKAAMGGLSDSELEELRKNYQLMLDMAKLEFQKSEAHETVDSAKQTIQDALKAGISLENMGEIESALESAAQGYGSLLKANEDAYKRRVEDAEKEKSYAKLFLDAGRWNQTEYDGVIRAADMMISEAEKAYNETKNALSADVAELSMLLSGGITDSVLAAVGERESWYADKSSGFLGSLWALMNGNQAGYVRGDLVELTSEGGLLYEYADLIEQFYDTASGNDSSNPGAFRFLLDSYLFSAFEGDSAIDGTFHASGYKDFESVLSEWELTQFGSLMNGLFDEYASLSASDKQKVYEKWATEGVQAALAYLENISGAYATGGFPEDGFFFANHNELVGQFSNGKTAVANNAQIVEGIKQGVIEAMYESGGSDGGNIVIQLVTPDGEVQFQTTVTKAERKNRRDGKVIIPVGT